MDQVFTVYGNTIATSDTVDATDAATGITVDQQIRDGMDAIRAYDNTTGNAAGFVLDTATATSASYTITGTHYHNPQRSYFQTSRATWEPNVELPPFYLPPTNYTPLMEWLPITTPLTTTWLDFGTDRVRMHDRFTPNNFGMGIAGHRGDDWRVYRDHILWGAGVPQTEEQRAAYEQQQQLRRELQEQWDAERKAAEGRAEGLLLRYLNEEQKHQLKEFDYFTLKSSSGKSYRVRRGRTINVDLLDAQSGKVIKQLCAHPGIDCPNADTMLQQKIMLELDEPAFLKVAKVWHDTTRQVEPNPYTSLLLEGMRAGRDALVLEAAQPRGARIAV